ncbi:molybdopterin molybdotransferase MoeA [Fulvivirga lutea]|uniref:Molybdopterin molybdenumtransferase n=1 Tax=Fulvivirga lutea TaxID=2810512 RepID=A0A974WEN6_9BACT|nr:molybdopterin molybdotransferase MoeA [Fulvivirga lutea]QSE96008.1 molybdopterin molybdotransferase MoeA [Fulvivirga lutea]
MISVQEAVNIIQSNLAKPEIIEVSFKEAVGKVLAEPISADRDFPPFDRVMMDGIAINYDRYNSGQSMFNVEATQLAGAPRLTLRQADNCLEVMTGAMLPKGVDTVIRYEDVTIVGNKAVVNDIEIFKGQNIHNQGQDIEKDHIIIKPSTLITPAEIGVITTVGKEKVKVYKPLKFAIISTGDELVPVEDEPKEYQIRQSNSHVFKSSLDQIGMDAQVFHIVDDKETLKGRIKDILEEFDALILSGGVSKGKSDFVPEVLEELGVTKHFHRVAQRPGKPFWFGTVKNKSVFALPGNPVSTFLCFNKYILPWLRKSYRLEEKIQLAQLEEDFSFKPDLTYFLQVKVNNEKGMLKATPVKGQGSGDLANLVLADGFIELPPDKYDFKAGELFPLIPYRRLD